MKTYSNPQTSIVTMLGGPILESGSPAPSSLPTTPSYPGSSAPNRGSYISPSKHY